MLAVAVGVVGGDDVGVPKAGNGPGLAAEALDRGGVGRPARRKQLDRDEAAHDCVLAEVDLSHPARS
jgi:hypothetical protein